MRRILVAVADSSASLAAARAAIDLARRLGAELRVIHVLRDGELAAAIRAGRRSPEPDLRRATDANPVLRHVAESAGRAGVPVTTVQRDGDVCTQVLAEAEAWSADLVVLGRSIQRGPGEPFLGAESQQVLEFADRPVLVVPATASTPSRPTAARQAG